MVILVSAPQDALAADIFEQLDSSQAIWCRELELFTASFAYEAQANRMPGFLQVGGRRVALDQIRMVLMRPPRQWWPSADFDLQDQTFIYHETMAAWFALLNGLSCRVANRFSLGWWVQDLSYPQQLRAQAARVLGVGESVPEIIASGEGRLLPTLPHASHRSVYLCGTRLVGDEELTLALASRRPELAVWAQAAGIPLCRLDFEFTHEPRLAVVEPFPILDAVSATLIEELSGGLLEGVCS